jgi:hypothetical protein
MTNLTLSQQTTAPSLRAGTHLLLAAAAALIAWEVFARLVAPLWIGGPLQPTGLVKSLFGNALGLPIGAAGAQAVHVATGLAVYPAAYWLATRVISLGWIVDGLAVGVATWAFALAVVAPLAGLPFLLGVSAMTWAALVGHIVYGLAVAGGFTLLARARG